MDERAFRSGYISILGRPNVGKSTLLNRLIQYRLAITSRKPQTTRNRILGVKNVLDAQMVFVDTPGITRLPKAINQYMVREALRTLKDADVVLMMAEADGSSLEEDRLILERLEDKSIPAILAINKIDRVNKPSLLNLIDHYARLYPFDAVVPVSGLTGEGVDILEQEILQRLGPGPQYFPQDELTDISERFLAGEVIREKVFRLCGEEIPYAVAVRVEEYRERHPPSPVYIRATIFVEKSSQKGILIGSGGRMLKRIGTAARKDLEELIQRSVYLELWVKVEKNWTKNEKILRRLGYQ